MTNTTAEAVQSPQKVVLIYEMNETGHYGGVQ